MGSTDWDRISKVRINELDKMSPDDIDILYEIMANVEDIDSVDQVTKLRQAFNVSQFVMINKAEECKAIGDELDEAKNAIKKLKNIKSELEGENAELQKGDGGDINLVREKRNWEMEKEQMEDEIRNLKNDNNSLRADKDLKEVRINDLDQEVERLRDENKKLSSNVEFLRDRNDKLKNQKDQTGDTNKSELAYARSELRQKKNDLDNAEQKMLELHQEIDRLKDHLEQATNEMERMTEEYRSMKRNVEDNNGDLNTRETEVRMLRTQLDNMKEQLFDKNESDDKVMTYVNDQVEKWKQVMEERDSEILRLYQEIKRLRQELQAAGVNSDKASVQALIKLVKEREEQIKDLSGQLVVATKTIDDHTDLIENLKKDLDRTGGGTADHQMRRIKELRQISDDKETQLKDLKKRVDVVESHAGDREQELTEALERNKMYERGEYGLAEAVGEIKACKAQLQVKERQNEQLCQEINKINYGVEELRFENGHLRSKLGIDADEQLDIDGYKRKKAADDEEQRAVNIVLQKEIENMEDERLMLKKKVRSLARQLGLKAGSAGISVEGIIEESYATDVEGSIHSRSMNRSYKQPPGHGTTWKIQEKEMNKELSKTVQDLEKRDNENAILSTKLQQLGQEHSAMTDGLKQLKEDLESRRMQSGDVLECPALDKMLVAMETRKMIGDFDTGIYMKTKIDNLEGRNHELRNELRVARVELEKLKLDYEKTRERALRYEEELKGVTGIVSLEDGSDHVSAGPGLPSDMPGSTSQTVAALNQHLIIALQEKSLKEETLKKMDNALDSYRRKFALIRHQQGLLYRQYADEKKKYEDQIQSLESKLRDLEGAKAEESVRLTEFDRLLNNLGQDDSELKRRLAELTRQMTLLRVNEKILCRKFDAVQEMEQTLRRENNKVKNEMIQIEAVVTERVGYYRRFKETTNYKLNVLHKELEDSVPRKDLTKLQLKFDELTEKYRSFLEKQNHLISRGESITQLEAELNKLRMDHEGVKKLLEIEKQRRHVLETAFEAIGQESSSTLSPKSKQSTEKSKNILTDAHVASIAKKVTTLEMKELNERERADHATRMYDNIKNTWNESEKRNKELEDKLSLLTASNLDLQKIERELRDELIDSVSKEISDQLKQRVLDLEQREMRAKHEIEKLKEISDIATTQVNILQQQQVSREKEMTSLRQQLLDIQAQTDEKSLIGKLHRHIVQLQLSESAALRKLDDVQRGQKRLEAQILKMEQTCDEKDQSLYHTRIESRARAKHLKDTINSLRSQFSGSISLIRQERFTRTLVQLTEEKVKLDHDLQNAIRARFEAETKTDSFKIMKESQDELTAALTDKKSGSVALTQWHKKLEQVRLEEMRQRRLADRLRHEIEHLEGVVKCDATQITQLDEDLLQLMKEFEEKQLQWEHREDELECRIYGFENIQGEVIIAARSFQDSCSKTEYLSRMPDPNAPLTSQLEHALTQIRKNVRILFDKENENKVLRKALKDNETKMREMEKAALTQERFINEMRLRLPATDDRGEVLSNLTNAAINSLKRQDGPDYVDEKTRWAAQTTLNGLKERLKVKDESLLRYEQMLKESREDLEACNRKYLEDVKDLQEKLKQARLEKMRLNNKNDHMENHQRNADLEDLLAAERSKCQENLVQIANLKRELESQRLQSETNNKIYESKLKEMTQKNGNDNLNLKEDNSNLKEKLNQASNRLEFQDREIEGLKEKLSRSVNVRAEKDVADLKDQLEQKKRQVALLTKSLQELKQNVRDMSKHNPDMSRPDEMKEENFQKLIDKHTKELNNQLEGARDQILQYQRELRALKADKDQVQMELDGMKADSDHNGNIAKKLKADRKQLEQDNDDLRNQLQRIKNLRNLSSNDAVKQQLEESRLHLHLLEEENSRLKKTLDKPEKELNFKLPNWETEKRNQKTLEKTKDKLNEKENELEKLKKQLDITTGALDRSNKEKQVLQGRLTDKWGPGALINIDEDVEKIIPVQAKKAFSTPKKQENLDDLMKKNMALEREIQKLCNGPNGEGPAVNTVALKEAEMRNRLLQSNINDLERRLVQTGNISGINLEKERAIQKENMRLNGENLELRCEVEASRKEIPRLREKVSDLQKYVESLKADKDGDGRTNRSIDSTGSSLSNVKKIGESGKSSKELEKTIGRLKKVVEKLQGENEMLKEAPGVVMNEQSQFLRSENQNLKSELSQLKDSVGQKLAERYDAKEKGMAKLLQENEKMRKDLNKEYDDHEKTRMDLKQMAREVEKLEKEKAAIKGKLEIADSRNRPRFETGNTQDEINKLKGSKEKLQFQLEERNRQIDELLQNSEMGRSEDLKNRYKKATEKIKNLEGQLRNLAEQFGVVVKL